ncbi:MAG: SRPBCC family protein [Acidobacteria bacterium]|nr:SRPBCC family protein [Acidobacteriota bacterium]
MLKKLLVGLAAVIGVLLVAIVMQPDSYSVTRTGVVPAPPEVAFTHVNDFSKWDAWSPWAKLDPNMKTTMSPNPSGKGATYAWTGNDDVGEGKMTIAESTPSLSVEIDLEFIKPFESKARNKFTFTPEGTGTKVTWSMNGQNNFMSKAFGLFMNMDKMIGADFEKGLEQMKAVAK